MPTTYFWNMMLSHCFKFCDAITESSLQPTRLSLQATTKVGENIKQISE